MPPARIDPERLRHLIEVELVTQRQAAATLEVSASCVERTCRRLGLATQRTGPRSGERHTGWKGGVRIVKGYRHLYAPDHPMATKQGYVAEHRLVMAEALGRPLSRREVVHHRDGDPLNNDLQNLMLFPDNASHLRHELTGRVPRWTEEGKARIRAGVERASSQRRSKPDDPASR